VDKCGGLESHCPVRDAQVQILTLAFVQLYNHKITRFPQKITEDVRYKSNQIHLVENRILIYAQ
jgi:hypothetical protein